MKRKLLFAVLAALIGLSVHAQTWTGNAVAAGTFYLYNVGADKFLNNGDPAQSWGTNAYLQEGFGMDVVLARISDGVYTIDTNVSNGGDNHFMNSSTWTDGAATQWQFRAVEGETNTYQIIYNGEYLMATEALNDVEMKGDPGSRVTSTYWKLVSEQDFKDAMVAKAYSTTDPMDVSVFIKGRSFARNDGRNSSWTTSHNGGNWTWIGASDNKYFGNEAWNNTFDVHQDITGLPDGTYEVRCSGFGTNGTTYIYGNNKTGLLQTDNATSRGNSKEAKWTAIHEDNAFAGQSSGTFVIGDGNLTVGIKRDKNNSYDWAIWDEFRLYYYGFDVSEFEATLDAAVTNAQSLEGKIPTAAYSVLDGVITEYNKSYSSGAEYITATNAINNAYATAQTMVAPYSLVLEAKAFYSQTDYTDVDNAKATFKAIVDAADEKTTLEDLNTQVDLIKNAVLPFVTTVTLDENAYFDVTNFIIVNPTVSENTNGWTVEEVEGYAARNTSYSWAVCSWGECEFYQQNFDFYQSVTLPKGTWEFGVTGFHREGAHSTYFYAGDDDKKLIPGVSGNIVNNMEAAKNYFDGGNGRIALKFGLEEDNNTLKVGIKNTDTSTDKWTIFRNFTLKYYGAIDYSVYREPYEQAYNAVSEASSNLSSFTKYSDAKNALDAVLEANVVSIAEQTKAKLSTATANLNSALSTYSAVIYACEKYNEIATAIDGKTNVDVTAYVNNPSFETGDLTSWTGSNNEKVSNSGNFGTGKVGTYFAERWIANGETEQKTLSDAEFVHDVIVLPAGLYKVAANGQFQEQYNGTTGTGFFLCANDERVEITENANYFTYVVISNDKDELTAKFVLENGTGNWICCDNLTLTYVDTDFPAVALVEGKMNADVATAQTNAKTAFDSDPTVANYIALLSAVEAAQASKDAYAKAAEALTKANSILNSTNVYTAEARTTYAGAISDAQSAYDEASMTDEVANSLNATLNINGYQQPAPASVAYLSSAWTSTNNVAVVNYWSTEGDAVGSSGMTTPFIQYWVADAEKLADNTITANLSGIENGLYSVTAFVRVKNYKDGDDAGYDGISMAVNDGTPVAFAEATEYTDGYAKEITAEGLVKGGTMTIQISIDGANASWLSFKNVTYTKVRDLTPEEEAVVPTAIALYNGEEEVSEAIILNGSETTVTLTTSLTPAEATPGYIEWESADENVASVANGVIKANGTGTTTITAKSTIDPAITATATIVAYAFKNQSFEADGNLSAGNGTNPNMIAMTGWTQEQNTAGSFQDNQVRDASTDNASNYGKRVTPSNGSYYLFYRHGWNGNNYAKFTSDVQNLPIGKYTLSVDYKMVSGADDASNNNNTSITLSAINGETTLATDTKKDATQANNNSAAQYLVNNEWTTLTTEFVLYEATDVQAVINLLACGPKRSDFVVDNVTLTWESIKVVLNDVLEDANDIDVTTNVGDAVFQIPQSAADDLTNAISTAQGVYDNSDATEVEVINQISALNDAIAAYADPSLNAPDPEKIYALTIVDDSKAWDGNAITFIAGARADQGGYGIKYLAPTNVNLAQGLKLTNTTGNKYKISVTKADGTQQYLTTAKLGYNTGNNQQIRTTDDVEKALEVEIRLAADGQFLLWNTAHNAPIANNDNDDVYTSRTANFTIAETSKPEITINTTAAGWGTTMLPFAVELPEGVKAYTCEAVKGASLTLDEVSALEANKPYIIEGSWNETLDGDAQGTALTYTEGYLTGVYAATKAPEGSYVLQKNNDKVGFYRVAEGEGKQPTVGANRAYLTVPAQSGEVKAAFFFDEGTATAIQSVFNSVAAGEVYDIAGRKVSKLQKGVNIVNGKKVLVK